MVTNLQPDFFLLIFLQSYTILSNVLIARLLSIVYLFSKLHYPTLIAKQLVLVSLRGSIQFINPIFPIPKQVVLVSRKVSPE